MKYIEGEEIISSLAGRIVSYDKTIPDCLCEICLTQNHIYVAEDNYDGTYTFHITLDTASVTDMRNGMPYSDSIGTAHPVRKSLNKGETYDNSFYVDRVPSNIQGKAIERAEAERMRGLSEKKNKNYFSISYNTLEGKHETVYFDDCSRFAVRSFIKKYEKFISK